MQKEQQSFDPIAVANWATLTLRRFGSLAFVVAVRLLQDALQDRNGLLAAAGISDEMAILANRALHTTGLLRELCSSGTLAQTMSTRQSRHQLIFRLLKLLPISYDWLDPTTGITLKLELRKAGEFTHP